MFLPINKNTGYYSSLLSIPSMWCQVNEEILKIHMGDHLALDTADQIKEEYLTQRGKLIG